MKKMDRSISLVFPQWQGYGLWTKPADGAVLIASQLLASYRRLTVPVDRDKHLSAYRGILGYYPLLRQLDSARELIRKEDSARLLTIGGDCGIEVAPISFLNKCYDSSITVVWFDAHADLNTPLSSPSGHFHGMPLRVLLGEGDSEFVRRSFSVLRPDQIVLAGCRDIDPGEVSFIRDTGIASVGTKDLLEKGFMSLDNELRTLGAHRLYIHLDLDVLDPSAFPYVSLRVPGGLTVESLIGLVSHLADHYDIVGMSVTEFTPEGMKGLDTIREFIKAGFRTAG